MRYELGVEVTWTPGWRAERRYGKGPHKAVYVKGHPNIRGKSTIFVEQFKRYVEVLNSRITDGKDERSNNLQSLSLQRNSIYSQEKQEVNLQS